MKYYRMLDDLYFPKRWNLQEINFKSEDDIWKYVSSGAVKKPQKDLVIEITDEGDPLDITMAEFEILIGNEKVAAILDDNQVQKVPISINGIIEKKYFILVILHEVDCIDRNKSEFELWEENNPIRPDLAGKYQMISNIKVDPSLMNNYDIVRIKDFNVAVIVSERLKNYFEADGITGVKFEEV